MKNVIQFLTILTIVGLFTACTQAPKAPKAEAEAPKETTKTDAAAQVMKVDIAKSVITWIGTKPVGQHKGTLHLKSGNIGLQNGKIQAGGFVIDMNSLMATDQDEGGNAKLTGHLKSADFFDVEKFGEAKFDLTGVADYTAPTGEAAKEETMAGATHMLTGNLTMKGVTKSITFPAAVAITGNNMKARANFNIDRTQWGLSYGNDKSLGDKFIRPEVNLELSILASAQ